jgi:hypothetical protein
MALEIHLVGSKWRNGKDTLDGFKVIRVELELGEWINNEHLYRYVATTFFDGVPVPGQNLYECHLDKIIEVLSNHPAIIYGDDLKQAEQDLETFIKAKDWLKKNFPNACVEFDIAYTGL